jgi:hypothetical protein
VVENLWKAGDKEVIGHRLPCHDSLKEPVFRNVRDPMSDGILRAPDPRWPSPNPDLSEIRRIQAEQGESEGGPPGASRSDQSQDLTAVEGERDPLKLASLSEVHDLEDYLTARCVGGSRPHHIAACHPSHQGLTVYFPPVERTNPTSVPQNRHPVYDLQHLIQPMADEQDRHSLSPEVTKDRKEAVHVPTGEGACGLIQDQEPGRTRDSTSDGHQLLICDGEFPYRLIEGKLNPDPCQNRARQFAYLRPAHEELVMQVEVNPDVLRYAQVREEGEVLMDNLDPKAEGVGRCEGRKPASLDPDLRSRVRAYNARKDLHERTLPRSVLSD